MVIGSKRHWSVPLGQPPPQIGPGGPGCSAHVLGVVVVVVVPLGHSEQHALSSPEPHRAAPFAPQNVPAGHWASVMHGPAKHVVTLLSRQTRPPAPQCVTQTPLPQVPHAVPSPEHVTQLQGGEPPVQLQAPASQSAMTCLKQARLACPLRPLAATSSLQAL